MANKVVITCAGRTGSQHISYVLNQSGLRSSHEQVYDYRLNPLVEPDPLLVERLWGQELIECSWYSAPFIQWLPADVPVWHQVRDPLKSLRCWSKHRLLYTEDPTSGGYEAHAAFVQKLFPECGRGSSLQRSVYYLLRWNEMIEKTVPAERRYRVEDLTPELVMAIIHSADLDADVNRVAIVIAYSPKTQGTCGHGPEDDISWDMVLPLDGGLELRAQAEKYGY